MGFANKRIAKVWEIKPKEKFAELKISTSKKNQEGEYQQDFSSYVRFLGKAFEKINQIKEGDMVKLLEVESSNTYDKDKGKMYYNFVVWDFEIFKNNCAGKPSNDLPQAPDDTDLPF